MKDEVRKIVDELLSHPFATCSCQSAAEHVRWVEKMLERLKEAMKG